MLALGSAMILIVDTSVLIDHLRSDARALDRLTVAAQDGHEIWSVAVVRVEILAGARTHETQDIDYLFARLRWLDVTPQLADRAGKLAAEYRASHSGIDTVDYLVAAAALELGAELLTQNVRHFPMIEDLRPAY